MFDYYENQQCLDLISLRILVLHEIISLIEPGGDRVALISQAAGYHVSLGGVGFGEFEFEDLEARVPPSNLGIRK